MVKQNYKLPSLAFLQSTHCTDTDLSTPIYLSSGMRVSGRTRQLFIPFGAAQGLRSGTKRTRVEDSDPLNDGTAGPVPRHEEIRVTAVTELRSVLTSVHDPGLSEYLI